MLKSSRNSNYWSGLAVTNGASTSRARRSILCGASIKRIHKGKIFKKYGQKIVEVNLYDQFIPLGLLW
jgi:hypothetical protein